MQEGFSRLTFKNGIKDGLPIGLGYLSVSFAFGVTASLKGIPIVYTILISMLNLTSAGQVAGVTVIASLGTIVEMILIQLVINSRYFLMSIALSQKMDKSFTIKHRLLGAFGITDEIFAVSTAKVSLISNKYFYGLILLPYIGWTLGTVLGAVLGDVLPQNLQNALGIALYAMFIAIIVPPSAKSISILFVVILSAGISCLFYFVPFLSKNVSQGLAIIISALVSAGVIALIFPIKENKK